MTVKGAGPVVGVAVATATGFWLALVYLMRRITLGTPPLSNLPAFEDYML